MDNERIKLYFRLMCIESKLVHHFNSSGRLSVGIPAIHRCERLWSWEPPPLPDYDLWIVLGGSGEMTVGTNAYKLERGFVALFSPGSCPKCSHDPLNRLTVFAVHLDFCDDETPSEAAAVAVIDDMGALDLLISQIMQLRGFETGVRETHKRIALWDLLFTCFTSNEDHAPAQADPRIREIQSAIDEDPSMDICLDEMAERCNLSRAHFVRIFKRSTGQSPHRYRLARRVERAKVLLSESSLTAEEVGEALGYQDPAYFNRQFKAATGTPPGSFRTRTR